MRGQFNSDEKHLQNIVENDDEHQSKLKLLLHGLSLGQFRRKYPHLRWRRKDLRELGVGGRPNRMHLPGFKRNLLFK